jgi:anti-sigma B factor antagonist
VRSQWRRGEGARAGDDLVSVADVRRSDGRATISLCGEVDALVEQTIVDCIRQTAVLPDLAAIEVDATGITFIDSSGLRALLVGREVALSHGVEFEVRIAANSFIARVFTIAGLERSSASHLPEHCRRRIADRTSVTARPGWTETLVHADSVSQSPEGISRNSPSSQYS